MIKAIVTGASGHLGFNVAKLLLAKNYEVHLLVRSINVNVIELQKNGAMVHQCDLFDADSYKSVLRDADVLFHLAAENTTSMANAERVLANTVELAKAVLNAALTAGVKTIIYTSSVVVLGRSKNPALLIDENDVNISPESPYVSGKIQAEQFVESLLKGNNVDIRRVYPAWVVGQGDPKLTPPHKVIKEFLEKGQIVFFEGGISIANVLDIANGHVNAFELGQPNEKYILGGENITFKRFYELLSKYSHQHAPKIKAPKWIILTGAYVLTKILKLFGKESPISPEYVDTVIGNFSWYDSTKAQSKIDYRITPIGNTLEEAVNDAYRRIAGVYLLGKQTKLHDDDVNTQDTKPVAEAVASNETLLITGVPGWLGNRMVDILINGDRFGDFRSDRKVRLLVESRFKNRLQLPSNFEIVYGDITNKKDVLQALEGVSSIFHLAGAIYPKHVDVLYKVNEQGTKNLVDACIEKKIRRIIFMGTDSICGHGTGKQPVFWENQMAAPYKNYGRSKYLAEKYILDKTAEGKIDGTSLRGFWFFGPFAPARQLTFVNMFKWPRQLVFGDGENFRSISHIDNVISAFFKAEKNTATFGKWYWIGNDTPHISVDQIYASIAKAFHVKYKPLYVPKIFCRCLELMDTVLGKFNYINSTIQAAGKFDYHICGTIENAKKDFGYDPKITLEDAAKELKEMFE
jgi:dihydroflavonol-4-reductase